MSRFLGSDIKTIEMNESTFASSINSNFKRFHSVSTISPSSSPYAISDSDLGDLSSFHRIIFVDTSSVGSTLTLTLPDPTTSGYGGKEIILVRLDDDYDIIIAGSGTTVIGYSTTLPSTNRTGLRAVFSCDGSKWYGTNYDN